MFTPFKTPKPMIPKGIAALSPEETAKRRRLEKRVLSVVYQHGYQEVVPPIFEYYDSLSVSDEALDRAYKFVDRSTGRVIVLRHDVTPQIARMAATSLTGRPHPLRLCYATHVFCYADEHTGEGREKFQIGGELIGSGGADADAEIIALAIESIRKAGLRSFKVVLGQMAFVRGILQPLQHTPSLLERALGLIARKETAQLSALLIEAQVPRPSVETIMALLTFVGYKEVLKRAASHDPMVATELQKLDRVFGRLTKLGFGAHLLIDLSEVRGFDYYTGTIFEVFADGLGSALGGGGRYDNLLARFGKPLPATGFALNVERLQTAISRQVIRR